MLQQIEHSLTHAADTYTPERTTKPGNRTRCECNTKEYTRNTLITNERKSDLENLHGGPARIYRYLVYAVQLINRTGRNHVLLKLLNNFVLVFFCSCLAVKTVANGARNSCAIQKE